MRCECKYRVATVPKFFIQFHHECIMNIYYKLDYVPLCVHYDLVIFYGRIVIFSAGTRDKCFKFWGIPYYRPPHNIFFIKMN